MPSIDKLLISGRTQPHVYLNWSKIVLVHFIECPWYIAACMYRVYSCWLNRLKTGNEQFSQSRDFESLLESDRWYRQAK